MQHGRCPGRGEASAMDSADEKADLSVLSNDELVQLCTRLERQVASGAAPLSLYGFLAGAHRELQRRGEASQREIEQRR